MHGLRLRSIASLASRPLPHFSLSLSSGVRLQRRWSRCEAAHAGYPRASWPLKPVACLSSLCRPRQVFDSSIERGRPFTFTIDGSVTGDAWGTILVAYNGEPSAATIGLPGGTWNLVADATRAGVQTLERVQNTQTLPPYSMVILWKP